MRILITGAGGMLGHDVCAAARAEGHETIALARSELDIANREATFAAVSAARPEVVVNCAAWTDVDGAEARYRDALDVNGSAAGQVAAAAASVAAWTLHVSSDYVFNGVKGTPYVESDLADPLSAYGRSKLEGELAVAQAAPDAHTIVRSSWLFGAAGKCFPKTILRLAAERDRLDVVCDQVGSPTFTGHLAAALVELAVTQRVGVLHAAAAGECSWFEFARAIVTGGALPCEVVPIASTQYPQPARRPAYSVLASERDAPVLPSWHDGLERFLSVIAQTAA